MRGAHPHDLSERTKRQLANRRPGFAIRQPDRFTDWVGMCWIIINLGIKISSACFEGIGVRVESRVCIGMPTVGEWETRGRGVWDKDGTICLILMVFVLIIMSLICQMGGCGVCVCVCGGKRRA